MGSKKVETSKEENERQTDRQIKKQTLKYKEQTDRYQRRGGGGFVSFLVSQMIPTDFVWGPLLQTRNGQKFSTPLSHARHMHLTAYVILLFFFNYYFFHHDNYTV